MVVRETDKVSATCVMKYVVEITALSMNVTYNLGGGGGGGGGRERERERQVK